MKAVLERAERHLAAARQGGDADDLAEALAMHANALIQARQFSSARQELEEAATIHRMRGRVYDEARCTQIAGTLCRFAGRMEQAKRHANRALELVQFAGTLAVTAHAELGEIELIQGNSSAAAAQYRAALSAGASTGLVDRARAALLRKRAVALVAAGQHPDAARDLEAAHALLIRSGDPAAALRTLIEQATALRHAGRPSDAVPIVHRALSLAEQADDRAALADLHLLLAAAALDHGDVSAAMVLTQVAREHALAGNSPTSYLGAAISIARLADRAGDRVEAYRALAMGWVTLADVLGTDAARASFAPLLQEFRSQWGGSAFAEIKQAYEMQRRTPDVWAAWTSVHAPLGDPVPAR